jgi:hypothetical protein
VANPDIHKAWARLAQDIELARYYFHIYSLDGGPAAPNPFLDELLASLCFVRLVSLLDDALEEYIAADTAIPRPKRPVLNDRIDTLQAAGRLTPKEATDLHGLRQWRNIVAHELQPTYLDWKLLDQSVAIAGDVLRRLGLVATLPTYEFFAERSKAEPGDQPNVLFLQRYVVGVRVGDVPELSQSWTRRVFRDQAGGETT